MGIVVPADGDACIYCGGDSSQSRRLAHVYPQCLVENDLTLPRGVECDRCNEFHGTVERELLNHNRIAGPIIHHGIRGADGRPRLRIGNLQRAREGLSFEFHGVGRVTSVTNDRVEIQLPDVAELNEQKFRRALYHIAINYLAYEAGADLVRCDRFAEVRRFVRYGQPMRRWSYVQRMYPTSPLRTGLGCRRFRHEVQEIVQIRTFIDDFYVDLDGDDAFLRNWAERTLPTPWEQL